MPLYEVFMYIDTLIIMITVVAFILSFVLGSLYQSWKIGIAIFIAGLIVFTGGLYYLGSLPVKTRTEIEVMDHFNGLKFPEPMKVRIITKYKEGCLSKLSAYELIGKAGVAQP